MAVTMAYVLRVELYIDRSLQTLSHTHTCSQTHLTLSHILTPPLLT